MCFGNFTIPADFVTGIYSFQWWWWYDTADQHNTYFQSCFDVNVIPKSLPLPTYSLPIEHTNDHFGFNGPNPMQNTSSNFDYIQSGSTVPKVIPSRESYVLNSNSSSPPTTASSQISYPTPTAIEPVYVPPTPTAVASQVISSVPPRRPRRRVCSKYKSNQSEHS